MSSSKTMQALIAVQVRLTAMQDADLTGVVIGISNSAACGRGEPRVGVSHHATNPPTRCM